MNDAEFLKLCDNLLETFRDKVPIDTGNMRYNSTRMEFVDKDTCAIYIDTDIAPYFVYTEFPWISPKWHGKKNPNEGWFEKACEYAIRTSSKGIGKLKKL